MRDKYQKLTKNRKKITKKVVFNKQNKKKIDTKQKKTKRKAHGLKNRLGLTKRRTQIFPTNNRSMRNSSPSHRSPVKKTNKMLETLLAINKIGDSTLKERHLDGDIKNIIKNYYLSNHASTIQNRFKTRKQDSNALKEVFKREEQYNMIEYDPYYKNTVLLTKLASNILTKKDKNDNEWKTILAKIYLGLHENMYQGGPHAQNYAKTDEYFIKIIKNLYNIDLSNNEEWFDDKNNQFLREELIYPYMEIINPVD